MQNWVERVHLKELLKAEIEWSVTTIGGDYFFVIINDKPAINFLWV
jgi:hypothetical protein